MVKKLIQSNQHLALNAFDVGELRPTGQVVAFSGSFKLSDKFLDQRQAILARVAKVLFANFSGLILPVFSS